MGLCIADFRSVEFNGGGGNSVERRAICNKLNSRDERTLALRSRIGGVDDRNSEETFKYMGVIVIDMEVEAIQGWCIEIGFTNKNKR